jgi:hypothetical protein
MPKHFTQCNCGIVAAIEEQGTTFSAGAIIQRSISIIEKPLAVEY